MVSKRDKNRKMGMSRRGFLKAACAAAAGPWIIPGRALGLDGAVAPSNRITVGFIGMGRMARGHLDGFLQDPECQVLAICDVERYRRERQANRVNEQYAARAGSATYTACDTYNDFRDLCARQDIDVVVIATPNHWHALHAIEALRSGKDVYLEKPLARTIEECEAIVAAVRRYNRVLQVGSQQRSDTAFRFACELVRNGRIGRVREVYANIGGPPNEDNLPGEPCPEGLDWDMWLGPCPSRPFSSTLCPGEFVDVWAEWRYYRPYAGGLMTDWGAHHFDIAQWGLGRDGSGPVEIIPDLPDTPDVKMLTYVYEDGTRLYRGPGPIKDAGVVFVGDEGMVGVNRGQFLVTVPGRLRYETFGPGEIHLYESADHRRNFLECVRTRREPICPAEIGASSATVCHIGNIAYQLKRPLRWDPARRDFVDDPEASRLRARAMRAPWQLT
ncbi:MAG TPA: Gfo/Idh/MocA family oxidoreductase [Candidatus Hydrogenedentes bacterium]|nr:Gfo/Idh/MocA family oxidoreductase [Candidatus Hydrogenedentota bacterium]HOK89503.1 Gfo/Idh/MocA family oxidoreductase [Candidatus Hydrogenedentota bacterium]HOV60474.1 Gfo/Idh/MocA family oxidoreductase [Candidatus Hydrogenedentota bacterium]